jgi:hypothetical protein
MPRPNSSPVSTEVIQRNLERLRLRRQAVDQLIASLEEYQSLLEAELRLIEALPGKPAGKSAANPRKSCAA